MSPPAGPYLFDDARTRARAPLRSWTPRRSARRMPASSSPEIGRGGLVKVACFFGDHVKTGIGTMLDTGSVVGAGGNVFGGLMPPPFCWGVGGDLTEYRLDKFVEEVARRDQQHTPELHRVLARAWGPTRALRRTG